MATNAEVKDLLEAGVHFGHLTRKWNPNMAPYIYMERNGIHVINLYKTVAKLDEACEALKKISASGRKILFVATKKQAKDIVAEKVSAVNMPYITERWPGGMLTNFVTIRKAVKKMTSIDRMKKDGTFDTLSKKERLQVERLRAKLEKNLGSISDMTRLPGARTPAAHPDTPHIPDRPGPRPRRLLLFYPYRHTRIRQLTPGSPHRESPGDSPPGHRYRYVSHL